MEDGNIVSVSYSEDNDTLFQLDVHVNIVDLLEM